MVMDDRQRRAMFAKLNNPSRSDVKPVFIKEPFGKPRELQPTGKFRREEKPPRTKTTFSKVSEISDKFAEGLRKGKARADSSFPDGRVFIDGDAIFSFGRHFPIAVKTGFKQAEVNKDKFSVTTTKQQTQVQSALREKGFKLREVDTDTIKNTARKKGISVN